MFSVTITIDQALAIIAAAKENEELITVAAAVITAREAAKHTTFLASHAPRPAKISFRTTLDFSHSIDNVIEVMGRGGVSMSRSDVINSLYPDLINRYKLYGGKK